MISQIHQEVDTEYLLLPKHRMHWIHFTYLYIFNLFILFSNLAFTIYNIFSGNRLTIDIFHQFAPWGILESRSLIKSYCIPLIPLSTHSIPKQNTSYIIIHYPYWLLTVLCTYTYILCAHNWFLIGNKKQQFGWYIII